MTVPTTGAGAGTGAGGSAGAGAGGMGAMGWAGLGLQTAGNVATGIGDGQALNAIQRVWNQARARQQGFDDQAHARTLSFLNSLTPDMLVGAGHTQQIADRLDSSGSTLADAVRAHMVQGGRHALPPGGEQRIADLLASQHLRDGQDARMDGMAYGARDVGQAADQFAGDRNRIVRDAQLWQGLVPYQLAAAGEHGGGWRGVGQSANTLGSGMMNWSMSQPASAPASGNELASTPGVAGVQPAQPQWQQPAQWRMGSSMNPGVPTTSRVR